MMGDSVNEEKAIFRKRIIATPVMRKKSAAHIVPRNSLALGRKEIPKTPVNHRGKSIGNASKHPKNIVYFEDEKPITSTFKMSEKDREKFYTEGISGAELEKMEEELQIHDQGFDRGNLFLYYCVNFICENRIRMRDLHVYHKGMFPTFKGTSLFKKIGRAEYKDPHHYQHAELDETIKSPKTGSLNQSGEKIANMHTFFVDCDGLPFDEFVSSHPNFKAQKIFSTVDLIRCFFRSVDEWMIDDVKFIGIVHPNAEGVEFSGLQDSVTLEQAKPNICFSAIGYGYRLPQAYSSEASGDFLNNFENEILAKLKTNMSSNCKDLMDQFNHSKKLRNTTYCENQSISAYISKAQGKSNSSKLSQICAKLEPNMIKDVFTKTNFVTLYKVTKVDSEHITIEKETLDEPTKKSLEKKLDEMLISIKN